MQEMQVRSRGWEDPLGRVWQSTPVFLPGESHGQRSLEGYSPWGFKESEMTEQLTLTMHSTVPGARKMEETQYLSSKGLHVIQVHPNVDTHVQAIQTVELKY